MGNDKYVVNFRYGRRGSVLKEGSKTPVPVVLQEAERLYDAVAEEKINKGYTTSESGQPVAPRASAFSLNINTGVVADWMSLPDGRSKAILKRLQQATQGTAPGRQVPWKLSRVIWKAGVYKIKEATPFLIQLFQKGDTLHQYACTWALVRCAGDQAIEALQAIYKEHPSPLISKIAGAGLLATLNGLAREQHVLHYLHGLPKPIQSAIETNQAAALAPLLRENAGTQQASYTWLENIYLLSLEKKWVRPLVKELLLEVPFQPGYFKHVRAVYKLSELLDDFEIAGELGCRLEREAEMFEHRVAQKDLETKVHLAQVDEYINPNKELKKKNSRLAYSQKTRWYLHRRVSRRLQLLGNTGNTDYVKLATALLIAYNRKKDFKEMYSTHEYKWNGRNYENVETRFPQNAHAVFMHTILSGDHPDLELIGGKTWRIRSKTAQGSATPSRSSNSSQNSDGGLLKKLIGLFSKKKATYTPVAAPMPTTEQQVSAPTQNENGTPFLHLWNQLPQSYVQLLVEAELEEIHEFAVGGLTTHPSWPQLKEKLDVTVYKKLLLSPFAIPAQWGYTLATERYATLQPESDLISAMLNSQNADARNKGMEWGTTHQFAVLQQSDFVKDLLFVQDPVVRKWAYELIRSNTIPDDLKKVVVGKVIAAIIGTTTMSEGTEGWIKAGSDSLFALFEPALKEVPLTIIADLLLHPVAPVLVFGLQLLKANQQPVNANTFSQSMLTGLLQHSYPPVREAGFGLLAEIDATGLMKFQELIIGACVSEHSNVRQGIPPVIARMAQHEKAFGDKAAEILMPYLLRKETHEGLHDDLSQLLCNELSDHLQNANKETALNLLYGNYAAAQNVGVVILEKYTLPDQLTIPQVIALGGHENLTVRAWSWKFYREQTARIRYEKEAAIKLLESKWPDTRAFAMGYFRETFTAADWSPEILITLADSVKPDVEAFGRELITAFFDREQGMQYLLKLSQHPGEKMQLFATNYLERFAADDVVKIESLEFYFRSVLTRVNKSRIAKNRIYHFLFIEGRKSEAAAKAVSAILSEISATAAIGDKAKCIEILLQLRSLYEVTTPLKVKPIETRMGSGNVLS